MVNKKTVWGILTLVLVIGIGVISCKKLENDNYGFLGTRWVVEEKETGKTKTASRLEKVKWVKFEYKEKKHEWVKKDYK